MYIDLWYNIDEFDRFCHFRKMEQTRSDGQGEGSSNQNTNSQGGNGNNNQTVNGQGGNGPVMMVPPEFIRALTIVA